MIAIGMLVGYLVNGPPQRPLVSHVVADTSSAAPSADSVQTGTTAARQPRHRRPLPQGLPPDPSAAAAAPPPAAAARAAPDPSAAAAQMPTAEVREAQGRLRAMGFNPGPADGIVGPLTENAAKQYQRARGLEVTGSVDRNLLAQLRQETRRRGAILATAMRATPRPPIGARETISTIFSTTSIGCSGADWRDAIAGCREWRRRRAGERRSPRESEPSQQAVTNSRGAAGRCQHPSRTMKRNNTVATTHMAADNHVNRLLGLLSSRDYRRLQPHLRRVPLGYRQSLYRAHKRLGFVYFIESGVGSLVNTMANGQAAEVGTIGNEGVVGLPLLLGDDRAPTSVYVQVPGAGLRMTAARFSTELARSASMRAVMLRYAHALFNQVAQSAACNHFHSLQQRCCRWMLMTHDRMQSDEFLLTQEFLAMMLGVQRTGVSAAAGGLQRAGLIRYQPRHRHHPRPPRPASSARASATAFPSASSIVCSAIRPAARPGPASGGPACLIPVCCCSGITIYSAAFWKKRGF